MAKKGKNPVKTGKKQDTKFKKGQSGNPKGRKQGSRSKATILAEQLLDSEVKELVNECIKMAKAGDSTAMKICMDRLIPPRKDRPISLILPQIETIEDAANAMKSVANAVSGGQVTPLEGQVLSAMIENYRKVVETFDHELRLAELERTAGNGEN